MTASKDMSRPTSQHRLSVGSNASSLPARASYTRTHSHTTSLGSLGSNHRINRRKSSTFSPSVNAAAIEAAVESASVQLSSTSLRRTSVSKAALGMLNDGIPPPLPSSLPYHNIGMESGSAVADGSPLSSLQLDRSKSKTRRASDAARLSKKEKAANGELKCEHCGKAYKHGSCLSKHLWEHTPQWQLTSKLLISKHQQVQLLEAASVLVQMNVDGKPVSQDSDNSSSPAASGMSGFPDEDLSTPDTTPPPHDSKRNSDNSSAYSRSYQSVFSESAPSRDGGFRHSRHWSTSSSNRPVSVATSIADSYRDEDPEDISAAFGLISCSQGTPKSGPTYMPNDIPPVPPLPLQYAHEVNNWRRKTDVAMDDDYEDNSEDNDSHAQTTSNVHDDEVGMFGNMDA